MSNLKREMVKTEVSSLDITYSTLAGAKERIEYLIAEYGADATIDWYQPPYDDGRELYVFQSQLESDEAYNKRVELKAWQEKFNQDRERAEYERLKAKFEG